MPEQRNIAVSEKKRVAVVILNWNGSEMMKRFLPSVVRCSSGLADVIVADNGSDDDSLEMLQREFPSVEVIALSENYGFAEGYNQALKGLGHEFFVLLNSDVEVTEGWLEPMLAYMDAHADVAACQPKLLAERNRSMFEYAGGAGGFIDVYGYPFCRGRVFSTLEEDHGQYDEPQSLLWATGAALMVRRSDWESVGGLDGRFFAHMEEIDFCWRLRSRGRGVVCVPESRVYHVGGATLNAGSPRKTFLNFRNNLLLLYKNLPDEELGRVMRVRRWLDYIAAFKFLLTDGMAHARAVIDARREFKARKEEFRPQREENIKLATTSLVPEVMRHSLLYLYYIRHKKTFTEMQRFLEV